MIEMKQAVKNALEFIEGLYDKKDVEDFLLEEVELSEDEKYWLITVGFSPRRTQTNPLANLVTATTSRRIYKSVKLDAETGKPISLKIRETMAQN
jgi:hypothetical protein